jgi:hypothetical protein
MNGTDSRLEDNVLDNASEVLSHQLQKLPIHLS